MKSMGIFEVGVPEGAGKRSDIRVWDDCNRDYGGIQLLVIAGSKV